jgi:hypothetical protein
VIDARPRVLFPQSVLAAILEPEYNLCPRILPAIQAVVLYALLVTPFFVVLAAIKLIGKRVLGNEDEGPDPQPME